MSRFRTNWFRSGSSVVPALAGASSLTSTKTNATSESRTRSTMVLPSRIPIGRGCVSQKLKDQRASATLSPVTAPSHGARTCLAGRFFTTPKTFDRSTSSEPWCTSGMPACERCSRNSRMIDMVDPASLVEAIPHFSAAPIGELHTRSAQPLRIKSLEDSGTAPALEGDPV